MKKVLFAAMLIGGTYFVSTKTSHAAPKAGFTIITPDDEAQDTGHMKKKWKDTTKMWGDSTHKKMKGKKWKKDSTMTSTDTTKA